MAEPGVADELSQGVKDAQDKFNAGMGADGDASRLIRCSTNSRAEPGARRLAGDGHGRQLR